MGNHYIVPKNNHYNVQITDVKEKEIGESHDLESTWYLKEKKTDSSMGYLKFAQNDLLP